MISNIHEWLFGCLKGTEKKLCVKHMTASLQVAMLHKNHTQANHIFLLAKHLFSHSKSHENMFALSMKEGKQKDKSAFGSVASTRPTKCPNPCRPFWPNG